MEWYEVEALLEYEYYGHKDDWEQCRFMANAYINMHAKTRVSLENTIHLYWDHKVDTEDTEISKKDIERLRLEAKEYLKSKNNG
jgi:hypothetical protein